MLFEMGSEEVYQKHAGCDQRQDDPNTRSKEETERQGVRRSHRTWRADTLCRGV